MVAVESTSPPSALPTIVLVKTSPEDIVQGGWYRMPLLGLGYLAAYVREAGVSVGIVDAMFERLGLAETVERIVSRKPDLVGITAMTHEINRAAEVARRVRERLPGVQIVVGGPHSSALPRRTLEEYTEFDYVTSGEGEETLLLLARAIVAPDAQRDDLLGTIKGLGFRRGDEIVINEGRPWIQDLDALPMPAWDLYDAKGRADTFQIYASRGCPFQCIFCMRVLGDEVRYRSAQNVVDEFEHIVDTYQPAQIDFSDETFTMRREWVYEICDEIIKRGLHKRVRWFANGRVNIVDEEIFRRLREAGCYRMGFGIESGNQEILKAAHKGTTILQIKTAMAAAKRVRIETEAFYILGFPGETRATAMDTIRFAAQLNTTSAAFGIMVPYPGTKVAEMAAAHEGGYRLLSHDWNDFDKHLGNALELDTLTRRDLERLQACAYLWFYLRNFRLRALAGFVWEKRKAIFKLAGKLFGGTQSK